MNYLSPKALEIEPYTPGEQPRDRKYIKLNTNENAYPPSPRVKAAISGLTDSLRLYPDPDCGALRAAIARRHGVQPENVFVGNGSDEVLAFAFEALVGPEGVLTPDIGYSFYPVYADLFGLKFSTVRLNDDFTVPWRELISDKTVALANPNAPTSLAVGSGDLLEVAKGLARNGRAFIVDEAYCDFGGESMAKYIGECDNLLVVRTFSKAYSLAGMRVGYALGAPGLIDGLNRIKNSFNSYPVDTLAQAAARAAIEDEGYFEFTRNAIIGTREKFSAELSRLGFDVPKSRANFVFPEHKTAPARELFQKLREAGILVRYFDKPRLSNRLRITIGTPEDMAEVVRALEKLV